MRDMAEKLEDAEAAMREYRKTESLALRNALVMHYSYIPKVIAAKMRGYTASGAQVEDLVSQGMITLIDCVEKYQDDKGSKFSSYAFMRIKCANIDYIRKQDWLPRRVRKTAQEITAAYEELSNRLMREPTTKELAEHLELPVSAVEKHFSEISNAVMLSFDSLLQGTASGPEEEDYVDDMRSLPESNILQKEMRGQLASAIETLNERERLVVSLYYFEHLRLCEVAKVLEVSESRVSQMHSKAILKLRAAMAAYEKG